MLPTNDDIYKPTKPSGSVKDVLTDIMHGAQSQPNEKIQAAKALMSLDESTDNQETQEVLKAIKAIQHPAKNLHDALQIALDGLQQLKTAAPGIQDEISNIEQNIEECLNG